VTANAIAIGSTVRRPQLGRRIAIGIAAVALLAGAWLVWQDIVSPRLFPKRFGVVVDHALYRSGRIHPSLLPKVLDRYGIDDIVALTYPTSASQYQTFEAALAAERGIHIQNFALDGDGTGDPATVVAALVAVHDAIARGDQVLVHCAAGSERTGAIVYLYRTLVLDEPADSAYAELLRYGHRPSRNPKLEAFLNANMAYFADELVARGVIRAPAALPRLPEPTAS
jgi:protein tyrosine/serine phosphatase